MGSELEGKARSPASAMDDEQSAYDAVKPWRRWTTTSRCTRTTKILYLTTEPLTAPEGPMGRGPVDGYAQYGAGKAIATAHGLADKGVPLEVGLAKRAAHYVGHLWGPAPLLTTPAARCTRVGRRGSPHIPKWRCCLFCARRASGRSSLGLRRALFAALIAVGAGSLLFDLTLSLRLPSDADWAEAAGALRARARPGDAVQLWPAWAERARLFIDAIPVVAEEDLQGADYAGVGRLWVCRCRARRSSLRPMRRCGAGRHSSGGRGAFGTLALRPWSCGPRPSPPT